MEDDTEYMAYPSSTLADTVLLAKDIPQEFINQYPIHFSAVMRVANLDKKDMDDLSDDFDLLRLRELNTGRRGDPFPDRTAFILVRSYNVSAQSLARGAKALHQLAGQHKSIEYKDSMRDNSGGLLSGLFGKRKGADMNG